MSNILKIAAGAADNPSPLVIPNASSPSGYTILLAFRFPGNDSWCGGPRCAPSVIGLATAEQWGGPYTSTGRADAWPAADR
jgi:subtilisin family serine protease